MPRYEITWIEPPDPQGSDPSAVVALRAAFQQISPEHRAVVVLHMHFGYTVAETAAIVGVPDETVRSRLRLAQATASSPSSRTTAMTDRIPDEQLDREIRTLLAWQAEDIADAPSAIEMATRISERAGARTRGLRLTPQLVWVVLAGLLILTLIGAAVARCAASARSAAVEQDV